MSDTTRAHVVATLALLGKKVRDKISGIEGIATSVSFDLYGCDSVIVHRGLDKDGKPHENHWYDTHRLEVVGDEVVMENPWAETGRPAAARAPQGPESKPPPHSV